MLFWGVNTGGYIEVSGGNVFAEDVCHFLFECVQFACFLIALPPTPAMCECQKVNLIVPADL